jgi:hypothetical protein
MIPLKNPTLKDPIGRVPGKIFILGEYSILDHYPALVATVQLPTGTTLYGFGSSTARYVDNNAKLNHPRPTDELWHQYRLDHPDASGADLVAQDRSYRFKERLTEVTIAQQTHESAFPSLKFQCVDARVNRDLFIHILVFSAAHLPDRKLRTYEDLSKLKTHHIKNSEATRFPDSTPYLMKFYSAKNAEDLVIFDDFADAIAIRGLESQSAQQDRSWIKKQAGVIAVKGCGAGLNDVFLVVSERPPFTSQTDQLIDRIVQDRKLRYLGTLHDLVFQGV